METLINSQLSIPTLALIIGFILDSLIGDPYKMPHPIKFFGNLISFFEKRFNSFHKLKNGKYPPLGESLFRTRFGMVVDRRGNETTIDKIKRGNFIKGMFTSIFLIGGTWTFFYFLMKVIKPYPVATVVVTSVFVFYGIANHMLIKEGLKVERALRKEGLEAGRKAVSMIVGRETDKLSANQIRKAVLETLAENLSDGVIAPLFYYAIGGIPGIMAYKMTNTLDSMIGYKSDRYKQYGCFAAKFDDVANYIPARITALLMIVVTFSWRGLKFIFKFGNKHSSPNAGYPESALAGILNVQFGGPNYYYGKLVDKPFVGLNNRDIKHSDIIKASIVNALAAVFFVVLILLITLKVG